LPRGSVRLRSDTYLAQASALRAGVGIGLCQSWLAERTPELLRLDRPGELPTLPVWVAANDDLHCNPRIRAVFDHLVAVFGARFGAAAPGG
jgi:DNA-binding transcriptional LysR family regulator